MLKFLAPVIAFGVMIPVFIIGLNRNPNEIPSPLIDAPAPRFELPSLLQPGETVGSEDYAGQVALLNVWATWCVGCRQEHEYLMELSRESDVPIYGLNWRDQHDAAVRWLEQLGDPYVATAYDGDGRVGIDWGVYGAPETFLIAPDGTVVHKHISPMTEDVWTYEFLPRIEALREDGT